MQFCPNEGKPQHFEVKPFLETDMGRRALTVDAKRALEKSQAENQRRIIQTINEQYRVSTTSLIEGVRAAVHTGKTLKEAKERLDLDGWSLWLRQHTTLSVRKAQVFIDLAEAHGDLTKTSRDDVAAIREAMQFLVARWATLHRRKSAP